MTTSTHLSTPTRFLHWFIAFSMIALMASGIIMHELDELAMYPWHKSFGIVLFFIALWRIVWRIIEGWPAHMTHHASWERKLAKLVQYVLIVGTVLMPVSGVLMSGMGGHGVAVFGWEWLAANPSTLNPAQMEPIDQTLAQIGHILHGLGSKLILLALVLHIVGAFKHHLQDKDDTLLRMIGRTRR